MIRKQSRRFARLRGFINRIIGFEVLKFTTVNDLVNISKKYNHISSSLKFLENINEQKIQKTLSIIDKGKAQIHQDLFVLLAHNFKKHGFFIEFGATNGVFMSNTWILEKEFDWGGIVAEPGKHWKNDLNNNRVCSISNKCVWKESGTKILFNEASDAGYSTIDEYSSLDHHSNLRSNGKQYNVQTTSLNDLLESHNAPKEIDYLSIDTEGSEFDILYPFDFVKWDIAIITVEHNYSENRDKLQTLLESKGYIRVLTKLSQFDDWYVKKQILKNLENAFLLKLRDMKK